MSEQLSKLINLINSNNFQQAEKEVKQEIALDPDNFNLNKILGISLLAQKKYNSALPVFNKCYNIKKDDYDVNVNISYIFLKIQEYEMVIKFANEALIANKDGASAYQNLAACYLALRKFDKAENYAFNSINLRGGMASREVLQLSDLINIYADTLIAQNKNSEFIDFAKKILDSGSYQADLFKKLMRNNKDNIEQRYVDVIEDMLNNKDQFSNLLHKNSFCASAHFCLGEYYSKVDQGKSEENFILANKYISDMQRTSLFKRQKMYLNIFNFFKTFDQSEILKKIPSEKGAGLIFITGMPRSGTTLTESILATSPDVIAGGERVFFPINLEPLTNNLEKHKFEFKFFADLGDRYLKNIEIHREQKKFFVDKLPENYLYYKFIKLALPGAKFIHLKRDPWDNAISLFKEFYAETVSFASSFFGIALEMANHDFITDFWKKQNDDIIHTVNYEDLVSNTDKTVDKMWSFCQLDGKYIPDNRKNHFAATASKQQVTQEIFKSSMKKQEFLEYREKFYEDLSDQKKYLELKV